LVEKKIYCVLSDEAIKIGYKMGGNAEQGVVMNETRDGVAYRVRWEPNKSGYVYPKPLIKILPL
jgi:hypothetical protein